MLDLLLTPHPQKLQHLLHAAVESRLDDSILDLSSAESWCERRLAFPDFLLLRLVLDHLTFLHADVVTLNLLDFNEAVLAPISQLVQLDGRVLLEAIAQAVRVDASRIVWDCEKLSQWLLGQDPGFGFGGEVDEEFRVEFALVGGDLWADEGHGFDLAREMRRDGLIGNPLV